MNAIFALNLHTLGDVKYFEESGNLCRGLLMWSTEHGVCFVEKGLHGEFISY
mgnify:CR=1 FL=1